MDSTNLLNSTSNETVDYGKRRSRTPFYLDFSKNFGRAHGLGHLIFSRFSFLYNQKHFHSPK
jgi:hypothetical protein